MDAQPSEQLGGDPTETLVLTGIVCDEDEGLPGLKEFKHTPFEDRTSEASRLATALEAGDLSLYTVSVAATFAAVENYAAAEASSLGNIMRPAGKRFRIGGKRVGRPVALGIVWYAVGKMLIGLQAAHWAKKIDVGQVTLLIDPLPGSPTTSMALLREVSTKSELALRWKETIDHTGVVFQIGNLNKYRPGPDEPEQAGKDHPHSILADWVAHSLYACFEKNQAKFLAKHATRSGEELADYLEAVKEPWFALHKMGRGRLVSLNQLVSTAPAASVDLPGLHPDDSSGGAF